MPPAESPMTGTVTFLRDLGGTVETFVEAAGQTLVAVTTPRERSGFKAGDTVGILLPFESCVVVKG